MVDNDNNSIVLNEKSMITTPESLAEYYGLHRVLTPKGVLPQAAKTLDNNPERLSASELIIHADTLHIDSASFLQIQTETGGTDGAIIDKISTVVSTRGKMHNPVTGSGGMLCGTVISAGDFFTKKGLIPGTSIATLVSLTLTPLFLREIMGIDQNKHEVFVDGTAVVFPSGSIVPMPHDMPEDLALSLFDVAGVAPQIMRLVNPGDSICIFGCGGKSGLITTAAALEKTGANGFVVGVEQESSLINHAEYRNVFDELILSDVSTPVDTMCHVFEKMPASIRDKGFDLVVSCVNTQGAEAAAILLTKTRGKVYFFCMGTSFTKAALGAEGISKDIDLLIGNGYCENHADVTLTLVRQTPWLHKELLHRYG